MALKKPVGCGFVREQLRDTVPRMLTRKIFQIALTMGLSLFAASTTVACSSTQTQVKTADHIKPGAMPDGGEWQGVYYDQLLGFLHITTSGNAAQGAWRTTAGDKWGELYGEIDGDMLRYTWTERKVGVVGPGAKSEGKGYFKYTIPKANEPHVLKGEWGMGENEVGHPWESLKQTNMEPDPKSVRPDEMESQVGASGFDGAKGDADIRTDDEESEEGDEGSEGESEGGEEDGAPDPL